MKNTTKPSILGHSKSLKQGKTNHCRKEREPGESWEEDGKIKLERCQDYEFTFPWGVILPQLESQVPLKLREQLGTDFMKVFLSSGVICAFHDLTQTTTS